MRKLCILSLIIYSIFLSSDDLCEKTLKIAKYADPLGITPPPGEKKEERFSWQTPDKKEQIKTYGALIGTEAFRASTLLTLSSFIFTEASVSIQAGAALVANENPLVSTVGLGLQGLGVAEYGLGSTVLLSSIKHGFRMVPYSIKGVYLMVKG